MCLLRACAAAAAALVITSGCEEEMRAPPPPVTDGSTRDVMVMPPPPPGDSGAMDGTTSDASADATVDASDAAGDADAGLPLGCFAAGTGTGIDATITSEGSSFPFTVNRAFATWDPAFCITLPRTIIVGLTEGSCAPSADDQLIFALAEDRIGTSIFIGDNFVSETSADSGLGVRFRTVGSGGTGEVWGACTGSSGTVTFTNLGSSVGDQLTATFDMTLTDCTEPFDSPPLSVSGSFDLPLEISFETACE
jgi:hypothetical protein